MWFGNLLTSIKGEERNFHYYRTLSNNDSKLKIPDAITLLDKLTTIINFEWKNWSKPK